MDRVVSSLKIFLRIAPLVSALACGAGCSVDNNGLTPASTKLQHDAGAGGQTVVSTGTGGAGQGSGGTGLLGTGGAVEAGGTTGTGGLPGTGGAANPNGTGGAVGTGGVVGTGGDPGTGGMTGTGGAVATGGVMGTGGASGTGGLSGGTGGSTGGSTGSKCGPSTCAGCCGPDGCVRTPTAAACGSKGAACVACGACDTCSAGACAIDPSSQWTIVADSVRVNMSPPGGGTWDPAHGDEGGAAPDLFCEYENPANDVSATTAGVTGTVVDVYSTTWDEVISPAGLSVSASVLMAAQPAWRIWVGDEDCSSPTMCGSLGQTVCSYQQPISAAALEVGQLTISNYQSCASLTLSFVCQAPSASGQ